LNEAQKDYDEGKNLLDLDVGLIFPKIVHSLKDLIEIKYPLKYVDFSSTAFAFADKQLHTLMKVLAQAQSLEKIAWK
jgi:hypothetical protein